MEIRNAAGQAVFVFDPDSTPPKFGVQQAGGWIWVELANNVLSLGRAGGVANPPVRLNGQNAEILLGGNGATGGLVVRDLQDRANAKLDGFGLLTLGGDQHPGGVTLKGADGKSALGLGGGGLHAGGDGTAGKITVVDDKTRPMFEVLAADGQVSVGGFQRAGRVVARAADKSDAVVLDGSTADVTVGHAGATGTLVLNDTAGNPILKFDAAGSGTITLFRGNKAVFQLDGATGEARFGGGTVPGQLFLRDGAGKDTIHLRSGDAIARVGGNGKDGRIRLCRADNDVSMELDATSGDIILQNADCAEDFDIADGAEAEPGTVMVLDEQGSLRPSARAYDSAVVGVVAGAGDFRPGIVLDRTPSSRRRAPLSMVGKAYCMVDATTSAIAVGDLLASSDRPGHAMKAGDPARAFGAVLGKALRPLGEGTGLIPILVALQ
ncbi:hypothetical protein [Saccharothrix xinjiangensis]|uniref:Calcium-binding protein n=1 Tax=Saccharothrix xinjiangensis TaxID=204798 RepID=A0ABV9YEX0_9PSEU